MPDESLSMGHLTMEKIERLIYYQNFINNLLNTEKISGVEFNRLYTMLIKACNKNKDFKLLEAEIKKYKPEPTYRV